MNGDFVLNNGDYFEIYSPNGGYYVWYHTGDTSVDPKPYGLTGIPVDWTSGSKTEATVNAIDAVEDFSAYESDGYVIITNVINGNVVPEVNLDNIALNTYTVTDGSPNLDTTKYSYEYDTEGRLVSVIIDDSEKHTFSYDENGSIKTYTISYYDIEAENWVINTTLTFNIPEGISFDTGDIAPWTDPIGNMMIDTLLPPD